MKRFLVTLVAAVAILGVLVVGCAEEGGPAPEEEAAPEEEEKAPAAPEQEKITWQFQGHPPVADFYHQTVLRIAEHITTMSGGVLTVEPYAGGAIVPATEELPNVYAGVIDMGMACPMYNLDKFPQSSLFDMVSGGLTPLQMFLWHLRGDPSGDELAAEMWETKWDVEYIAPAGHLPPEVWAHSNKELNTPDDLKGLKMRCAGDGGEILASMGVSTVFFPGAELYESAQRGVIDAFEYASPFLNWEMGFHEVTDYMYLSPSRAPTDTGHVLVNKDRWEELTPDLQQIVHDAVRTVGLDYYAESVTRDDTALVKYEEYGTKVLPLPEEIEAAYLEAAMDFYDKKAAGDPLYGKILESMWEFKAVCDRAGIG